MADGIVGPPRSRERQAAGGHSHENGPVSYPLRRAAFNPGRALRGGPGPSGGAARQELCRSLRLPCGWGLGYSPWSLRTQDFPRKGAIGCGLPPRSTRPSSPRPRRAAASARSSSPPSPSRRTRAGSRSRSRSGWPASACGTSTRSTSSASPGRTSRRRRAGCSTSGNWIEFPSELTGVKRPHRRPGRQVLPDRRAQGRRRLRLPGAAPGLRRVRPGHAEGRLALDRQLLPRRRLRLRAARLQGHRHPARGHDAASASSGCARSARTRSSRRPGTESNVKEIYDKCWELRKERGDTISIFNQFEEFGNAIWHYTMTGSIVEEVFGQIRKPDSRLAAYISATGSAGTIAAGDYLRTKFPHVKVVATEALQCPTLLLERLRRAPHRGHRRQARALGAQRAQHRHGRGHRRRAVHEPAAAVQRGGGRRSSSQRSGVKADFLKLLPLVGISSICNLVAAIKAAKHYELDGRDVMFTPLTDSMDLYELAQAGAARGARPLHPRARGAGLRALPRGRRDRLPAGARLPRPQAAPQPQVLHLGGAAGQDLRGAGRAVGARLLDRDLGPGRGVGPAHPAVQRAHGPAQDARLARAARPRRREPPAGGSESPTNDRSRPAGRGWSGGHDDREEARHPRGGRELADPGRVSTSRWRTSTPPSRRPAGTSRGWSKAGYRVVVTHGNGPQVGFILRRSELAAPRAARGAARLLRRRHAGRHRLPGAAGDVQRDEATGRSAPWSPPW